MKIKSKKDAKLAIQKFEELFKYDVTGQKHYVYFQEKDTENTLTIMKYSHGSLTVNRRGEDWVENGETQITEDQCASILWDNRAEINRIIGLRLANKK